MDKERLAAFTDAVLAIIMTILVLELEKPTHVTWAGIWALRVNYFAYALSFFWLGFMWLSHHNAWHKIKKVNNATVVYTLLMLFFASLFPYTTSIVAQNFNNVTAQFMYGVVILLVSLSNIGISHSLNVANHGHYFKALYDLNTWAVVLDLSLKVLGLILTVTVFPPAVLYAVLINVIVLSVSEFLKKDED
jgi:uncharacterized membrane protein